MYVKVAGLLGLVNTFYCRQIFFKIFWELLKADCSFPWLLTTAACIFLKKTFLLEWQTCKFYCVNFIKNIVSIVTSSINIHWLIWCNVLIFKKKNSLPLLISLLGSQDWFYTLLATNLSISFSVAVVLNFFKKSLLSKASVTVLNLFS